MFVCVAGLMKERKCVRCHYIVRICLHHAWIFGYGAFIKITRVRSACMSISSFFEGVVGM